MFGAGEGPTSPPLELPAGSPLAAHTFTDTQLEALLVGLDSGRCDLADGLLGPSLQFLPHLPHDGEAGPAGQHPQDQQQEQQQPGEHAAVFVPTDLSSSGPLPGAPLPLPPLDLKPRAAASSGEGEHQADGLQPPGPATRRQQQRQREQAAAGSSSSGRHARPAGQRLGGRAAGGARSAAAFSAAHKQPHSMVEKQRRDRINTLIDELRELVPPQGGDLAAAQLDLLSESRRPKHQVLADTIRLIKDLQLQVAEMHVATMSDDSREPQHPQQEQQFQFPFAEQQQQQQQQEWQPHSQHRHAPHVVTLQRRQGREQAHPELPHAPEDDAECGVVVELEEGVIRYVKVTCPDRHGLLADVVRALKELPLEITTAAITTRRDHIVYDVFEIEVDDPTLQPEAISLAVEEALRLPGEKKRKAGAATA